MTITFTEQEFKEILRDYCARHRNITGTVHFMEHVSHEGPVEVYNVDSVEVRCAAVGPSNVDEQV
jgi:hypothetical protein